MIDIFINNLTKISIYMVFHPHVIGEIVLVHPKVQSFVWDTLLGPLQGTETSVIMVYYWNEKLWYITLEVYTYTTHKHWNSINNIVVFNNNKCWGSRKKNQNETLDPMVDQS